MLYKTPAIYDHIALAIASKVSLFLKTFNGIIGATS
jgi:hypothetical protein